MQQMIVIHLPLNEEKSRSTALGIASNLKGVTAVKIVKEKNHLVVTGEGIDSVKLAKSLRKKFCFADIETVKKVESSEYEMNESDVQFLECQTYYKYPNQYYPPSNYIAYPVYEQNPPSCSIM